MPRETWYKKIASRGDLIVEKLFELLENRNPAVSLGAAKILANKLIPDLRSVEVSGDKEFPLVIKLTKDGFKLSSQTEGSVESAT